MNWAASGGTIRVIRPLFVGGSVAVGLVLGGRADLAGLRDRVCADGQDLDLLVEVPGLLAEQDARACARSARPRRPRRLAVGARRRSGGRAVVDHDVHVVTGLEQAGHAADAVDRDRDGDLVLVVDLLEAVREARSATVAGSTNMSVDEHLVGGEVVHGDLAAEVASRSRDGGRRAELLRDLVLDDRACRPMASSP